MSVAVQRGIPGTTPLRDRLANRPGTEVGDPRLDAWRDIVAGAATQVLRTYRETWTAGELDDAARATAGIGLTVGVPEVPSVGASLGPSGGPVRGRRPPVDDALPDDGTLAAVVAALALTPGEEALLATAWWAAADPQVAVVLGAVHDDPGRRYASPAAVRLLLGWLGIAVPLAVLAEDRLVTEGLLEPAESPDDRLRLTAVAAALLSARPASCPPATPTSRRLLPDAVRIASLVSRGERVVVRCGASDDPATLRDLVAARLGLAVAPQPRDARAARLLHRLDRELPALVVAGAESPPDGVVLALGPEDAVVPAGWHVVDVPAPSLTAAERCWRRTLRGAGISVTRAEVTAYASRLPLGERGIREVVERAVRSARAHGRDVAHEDVAAALRTHPDHDPAGLARRVPASTRLEDLVLPAATREGIDEVVAHARWSTAAHEELALAGVRGRGVVVLFHGPSGTGKTAAAEAVATAVERDLWVVDLAKVVSKWLGETQRNLDLLLSAAETAGVVLLFDEADGLFGKRGEVTDARDRYANLEIDFLLQRLELHRGVVVLTSNRPAALDEAFARRIRLSVRFETPGHEDREELWRRLLPRTLLATGASTDRVAREELTGAAIRAAALAATVRAMEGGGPVTEAHLDAAVRRELEKVRRPRAARAVTP